MLYAALGALLASSAACDSKSERPARTDGGVTARSQAGEALPVARTDWLEKTDAWDHVKTLPGCSTAVAREPALAWPGFAFESCGEGCRAARLLPPGMTGEAAVLGAGGRVVDGEFRLSLTIRTVEAPLVQVLGTFAFGSGSAKTLIAETGSDCLAQFAGRTSPQVLFLVPPRAANPPFQLAWIESGSSSVRWPEPPVETTIETFDFGTSWGRMAGRGAILVADSPLSTTLSSVYEANGILYHPTGDDGWLAFTEWTGSEGRILAWRKGQRASVVARGAWHPGRFGMARNRFAWLGATGPRVEEGAYESARLYFCTVNESLEPCSVEEGPALPFPTSDGTIALQGRWVALTGCSEDCDVYVFDRESRALYRVRRAHPNHGVELLGVSETELFVAEYLPGHRGNSAFDGLVRFDLTSLESIATRL